MAGQTRDGCRIVVGIGEIATPSAIVSGVIRISVAYRRTSPENAWKIKTRQQQ
jgi:hypothetical protein